MESISILIYRKNNIWSKIYIIFGEIKEKISNHLYLDNFGLKINLDLLKIDRIVQKVYV